MAKQDLKWQHEKFLYPVVRIFSEQAAGSGTIINCSPDPENDGDHMTFVLTNHHVVEDLIKVKEGEWDSVTKRKREKEYLEKAKVEVFSYVRMSEVDSSNRYSADIVAYDKDHDLAVLKLDSPTQMKHVADLIPEEKIKDLKLYMGVVVTGCSLAHDPFSSFGNLTYLKEIIDQKKYVMVNASSVFGNSGGALFLRETGELIGVPSRITAVQLGFGVDILTWMGFAAHPERIYEFLKEQHLEFLFNGDGDYYAAMKRRKKEEKKAALELKAEMMKEYGE
jgi:S1-C subfamily serine protease